MSGIEVTADVPSGVHVSVVPTSADGEPGARIEITTTGRKPYHIGMDAGAVRKLAALMLYAIGDTGHTGRAAEAITAALAAEHDFGGWLADVLVEAARRSGGIDSLTRGRPGSWEAALVDQLARGTADPDDPALYP